MYLTTVGRRTGRNREVIIGYFEDGADLVTMAMNGWGEAEPAWWLNVQAHPDVTANLLANLPSIPTSTYGLIAFISLLTITILVIRFKH